MCPLTCMAAPGQSLTIVCLCLCMMIQTAISELGRCSSGPVFQATRLSSRVPDWPTWTKLWSSISGLYCWLHVSFGNCFSRSLNEESSCYTVCHAIMHRYWYRCMLCKYFLGWGRWYLILDQYNFRPWCSWSRTSSFFHTPSKFASSMPQMEDHTLNTT